LSDLYKACVGVTITPIQAYLILAQEDVTKITDYETALESQFERKLQQLVAR